MSLLKPHAALVAIALQGLLVALLITIAPSQLSGQSANNQVKVQLWNYSTLCEFPDSNNWPSKITHHAGSSITVTGCSDLDKKLGHPQAVRVTVVNTAASELSITLDGLKSVLIKSKNGKTTPALAWRVRQSNPFNNSFSAEFADELKGRVAVGIEPGTSADLFFLFPSAAPGDSIKVGDLEYARVGH